MCEKCSMCSWFKKELLKWVNDYLFFPVVTTDNSWTHFWEGRKLVTKSKSTDHISFFSKKEDGTCTWDFHPHLIPFSCICPSSFFPSLSFAYNNGKNRECIDRFDQSKELIKFSDRNMERERKLVNMNIESSMVLAEKVLKIKRKRERWTQNGLKVESERERVEKSVLMLLKLMDDYGIRNRNWEEGKKR